MGNYLKEAEPWLCLLVLLLIAAVFVVIWLTKGRRKK